MIPNQDTNTGRRSRPSTSKLILYLALLLLLFWMALKVWRVARAALSLQAQQEELSLLLEGGFEHIDPDRAEQLLLTVRQDVVTLNEELALFFPIFSRLGWLPEVGPLIAAAPELLPMADAGTEAALALFEALRPTLSILQGEGGEQTLAIADMVSILDKASPELARAADSLDRVAELRVQMGEVDGLPGQIRAAVDALDAWLPRGQAGLRLAQVIPRMMGNDEPRHYLIIAQNEDELRPGGGFISGAGVLTVHRGQIAEMSFQDAYAVDDWRNKPYEFPPRPLYELMGLELFLFRDANFWPDFPTSAQAVLELYAYGQDVPLPYGLIAVDQRFIQLLLDATGPVFIPGDDLPLNSQNVLDSFRSAWSFQGDPESEEWIEWYQNRKGFIGTFALALKAKVESELRQIDPLLLAQRVFQAADEKHLQVYVRDPVVSPILEEIGWDGRIRPAPQADLLVVTDSNVGYSKANLFIERAVDYRVDLTSDGSAAARLAVSYVHTGTDTGAPCVQDISYAFDVVSDYLNLADRCYWNYLRVYAPEGSLLRDSSTHDVPVESLLAGTGWQGPAVSLRELPGAETFANYFLVPAGRSAATTFQYDLPQVVTEGDEETHRYRLVLVKQAGIGPEDWRITVVLPPQSSLIDASHEPATIRGREIVFDITLISDVEITLNYR